MTFHDYAIEFIQFRKVPNIEERHSTTMAVKFIPQLWKLFSAVTENLFRSCGEKKRIQYFIRRTLNLKLLYRAICIH